MEGVRPYSAEEYREYRKYWLNMTINEAFDRTCDNCSDRVALVEGEQRLTFSQVRRLVQKAALTFLKLGLGKDSLVLLHLPNWMETVCIYLGLKAIGAVPVLLLPRQGRKELEHFSGLTDAVAWIGPARYGKMEYIPIVTDLKERYSHLEHLIVVRDEAPAGTVSFTQIMEETVLTEGTADYLAGFSPSPDDVLHLGPTGGTTGLSKLVPTTHNAHLLKAYCFTRAIELGYSEVTMPLGPLGHEGPNSHSLCSWILFGGKMVLNTSTSVQGLLALIEKERVTYLFVVPALLTDILKEPDLEKYDLSSLSFILIGGAHASPELIAAATKKLPGFFGAGYGSTEGARTSSRSDDPWEVVTGTSGRKLVPYDTYKIVDEKGRELPVGQIGEIVFRGPCRFTGYYKSREDDGAIFSPDGFYYTGDMGKFDAQGNFIITGRKKDIIRRGAESISATEVEELVERCPKVARAAAIGMPDHRLGERICVYLEPSLGMEVTFDEIICHLKGLSVSTFLFPERIEVVAELPRTPMGKVDKNKLREEIARKLENEGKL